MHLESPENSEAALYVVATPIGHLDDITQRALATLQNADVIAAEDTRNTRHLLQHFGIQAKQILALHQHNELGTAQKLLALLIAGKSIALVSDAGTPAISDPGARLVKEVRAAGFRVIPIPGACAAVAALSASGLTDPHFLFYGFLPNKSAARRTALAALQDAPYTLVFYEAPHRVLETVTDLAAVLGGERILVIARELTKVFETIHQCRLEEAAAWLAADLNQQRGEFVLLVSGSPPTSGLSGEALTTLQILLDELPLKQAVHLAARISGAPKNQLYEEALARQAKS